MNKKGNTGVFVTVIIVLALALVGFFAFGGLQSVTSTSSDAEKCSDSTGVITVNAVDALQKSSAVATPTITAGPSGEALTTTVTSGTTTFPVGTVLDIFVSKTGYLDKVFRNVKVDCGGVVLEAPLYQATSDNPAIRIKNDDGDFMSDDVNGGSGTNQTNVAAGETITLDVEFTGTSLESSGDLVYVIEFPASTSANITKVELSGAKMVAIPTVHTSQNAGSKIVAFDVPAVVGSAKSTHTLTITLGASKDLAGGVYTDWYAKQDFIELDGSVVSGVENSEGTAKHENNDDFDFYIQAA